MLTDGWVCELADQDILVDKEMSSHTSAWQLQGDVRDFKTAFKWKGFPSDFVIAIIMMNILYSTNLKLLFSYTQIPKNKQSACTYSSIFLCVLFFQVLYTLNLITILLHFEF